MNIRNKSLILFFGAIFISAKPAAAFDHQAWDHLLQRYIKKGLVDYQELKNSDQARSMLKRYLDRLAKAKVKSMTGDEKLSFYLNAYNALVVESVLKHWPSIRSVKDIKGFFDQKKHPLAGRQLTLNDLENSIIRKQFKDPRIHFALVCAAQSCPPLYNRAFTAPSINKTLDQLTRQFINSKKGLKLEGDRLWLSKLFEWFSSDFEMKAGSIKKFVARYFRQSNIITEKKLEIRYMNYDWSLNQTN